MTWFTVYVSVGVAVLAVVGVSCARGVRHDPSRLVAIVAAAVLWPVLAIGLLQFGAIRAFADFLRRRSTAPASPVGPEADPGTGPLDLVDSLARLAQRVGATRPA